MDTAKFNEKKVEEAGKRTLAELQADLKSRVEPRLRLAREFIRRYSQVTYRRHRPREGRDCEIARPRRRDPCRTAVNARPATRKHATDRAALEFPREKRADQSSCVS